jgi:heme/copper-type cytochrome/quinol oxidase subunit 3
MFNILNITSIFSLLFIKPQIYFFFYFIMFFLCFYFWFTNINKEASIRGQHSLAVQNMLRSGFILFIVSEIMFFFSFFWSFFHLSVSPSIFLGTIWPADILNEIIIKPSALPLLNTFILLFSGVLVTWFHYQLIQKAKNKYFIFFNNTKNTMFYLPLFSFADKFRFFTCIFSLVATISMGLLFTFLQLYEYIFSLFNITDSAFGSIFYLTTGFHGAHVIVGTIFLIVGLLRLLKTEVNLDHHVGLEAAIYYWHFVDVVWLFLYYFLYIWTDQINLDLFNFLF